METSQWDINFWPRRRKTGRECMRSCATFLFAGLSLSGLAPGAWAQQSANSTAPQLTGTIALVSLAHKGKSSISKEIVRTIKFVANTPSGEASVPSATLKGLMDTRRAGC